MKRFRITALLLALCMTASLLSGCTALLERDYIVEEPHSNPDVDGDTAVGMQELSDYTTLRNAVQRLIENHTEAQTVRLVDYAGNVDSDVQHVVQEAMATPIGAFAVTNIAYNTSRILSYYEIRFDVTYRRTAQELAEIQLVDDEVDLRGLLYTKMSGFSPSIVFRVPDYAEDRYDFDYFVHAVYYENPQLAYGLESVETKVYPESGVDRIVELTVNYMQPSTALSAKSTTATDEAKIILDSYDGSGLTANRLQYFYDVLSTSVTFDAETAQQQNESEKILPKTDAFTVYGALIKKSAVSEGYALAFKQMCDMADIECMVISGKRDGMTHMWNMVLNHGKWSHVDCSADLGTEDGELAYTIFGRTDDEMRDRYVWDSTVYPAADSTMLRAILMLPIGDTSEDSKPEDTTEPEPSAEPTETE